MNITPEQAQEWLDWAIPGPWEASFDEVYCATRLYAWGEGDEIEDGDSWELARHAPDLAQTIAGMEWEYGLRQPRPEPHAEGELYTSWGYRLFAAKAAFAGLTDRGVECYIVRRLVGPVEVTE